MKKVYLIIAVFTMVFALGGCKAEEVKESTDSDEKSNE